MYIALMKEATQLCSQLIRNYGDRLEAYAITELCY